MNLDTDSNQNPSSDICCFVGAGTSLNLNYFHLSNGTIHTYPAKFLLAIEIEYLSYLAKYME
jgi:hypothetical protein